MNVDLSQILTFGPLAVLAGVATLVLLVRQDLAPAAGRVLDNGGRWFLGAALGFGLIAFTIKLAIISTLATFPNQTIRPLLLDPALRHRPAEVPILPMDLPSPGPVTWQELPAVAPAPADNPTTPEKAALGERLFTDPSLSVNGKVACSTCHDARKGAGDDGRATALGVTGVPGRRNSPTVFNAAFQARLFWDGRAASLEEQALGPLINPDEMGMPSLAAVESRVKSNPDYQPMFERAFGPGTTPTISRIAQAIAAYERTLIAGDSPYDRFVAGDASALDDAQKRGMWLFASLGCSTCHAGANFSGASLIGPRQPYSSFLVSRSPLAEGRHRLGEDKGKADAAATVGVWRIPSLRNVALTAPYFHNGSVADLAEAVRIMAATQLNAVVEGDPQPRATLQWTAANRSLKRTARKTVSNQDIADLVAFLKALSSERLTRQR